MEVLVVAAHLGDRAQFEREQVGFARVPEAAAIADHRVRLGRLVRIAAREVPKLVRPEVHRAVDDRSRRKGAREHAKAIGHTAHELIGASLRKKRARVHVLECLDHHELGAQQSHAVHVELGDLIGAIGLGEVDVQARRRDGRSGRAAGCHRHSRCRELRGLRKSCDHRTRAAVDRHDRSRREKARRVVRADDAGKSELARDDRRVRRHPARIRHDRRRAAHDRHPIGRRHAGYEHFTLLQRRGLAQCREHACRSGADAGARTEPANDHRAGGGFFSRR